MLYQLSYPPEAFRAARRAAGPSTAARPGPEPIPVAVQPRGWSEAGCAVGRRDCAPPPDVGSIPKGI